MNNVVLWYDDLEKGNCYFNDSTYSWPTITKELELYNVPFTVKHTLENLDKNELNVYVIELLKVYNKGDIFSLVSNNARNLFQQGMKMLLYYPKEGHELHPWLFEIYSNLKENNLLCVDIYFAFGNFDFVENYRRFLEKYNIESFLTPVYVDYFEGFYIREITKPIKYTDTSKRYDFLFYNGRLRPHRLLAVSDIVRRGLEKNALVSLTATEYLGTSYTPQSCYELLKKYLDNASFVKDYIDNYHPLKIDMDPGDYSLSNINTTTEWHYTDAFFSIVSETLMEYRFVSEKIYKPICNAHPFVVIGPPGTLDLLNEKGYKTFPEMFDESYDSEQDPVKRVKMVIDEVEKFSNLSYKDKLEKFTSVKSTLLYNQNLYKNRAVNSKEIYKIFEIMRKE